MRFQRVHVLSVAAELPPQVVTSTAIEDRLAPLYRRLGLPEGRLELMTGIRERRFWEPGTVPSAAAALAGRKALAAAGIAPDRIGCLVYGGVSRDFLEPATASVVHHALGLSPRAMLFDLSNACLGVLNGMVLVAGMIELGQIEAGLVVSGECAEGLVESTIASLLADPGVTRASMKDSFASLTIGSAAAGVVLAREGVGRSGARLLGGACLAATAHHDLCRGSADQGFAGASRPLMATRAEELLEAGCRLAADTWRELESELGWDRSTPDRVVTHQVGTAHRRRLYDTLGLDPARDVSTFERLGNTGSAALPATWAHAVEGGLVAPGQRLALLGIGSGISCLMLGVEHAG